MATPRPSDTRQIFAINPPLIPPRGSPRLDGAHRTSSPYDRRGRDRTAQRAAALLRLVRMHQLKLSDPEHTKLRELVIDEYMAYARHLAARYDAGGQFAEDLHQVAYEGLVKAVDNFDPDYGAAFLSYATPMILGELKRYFRDTSWAVHVPRRIQELSSDVRPLTEALTHRLCRNPTALELAASLDAEPRDIRDAIDAGGLHHVASLDMPVGTDQNPDTAFGDLVGAEDPGIQNVLDRETLRPLLARLPSRDKRILHLSFFQQLTQAQIGVELGVSQMQISRLLAAILDRLRQDDRSGRFDADRLGRCPSR
jgi:RNA polymerase sigma-B factor